MWRRNDTRIVFRFWRGWSTEPIRFVGKFSVLKPNPLATVHPYDLDTWFLGIDFQTEWTLHRCVTHSCNKARQYIIRWGIRTKTTCYRHVETDDWEGQLNAVLVEVVNKFRRFWNSGGTRKSANSRRNLPSRRQPVRRAWSDDGLPLKRSGPFLQRRFNNWLCHGRTQLKIRCAEY